MLFSSRHSGIELCLGPFKDEDDRTEKIKADNRKEEEAIENEREAGLRKLRRRDRIEEYRINRMLCDLLFAGDEPNETEE